jgi:putative hydrolase of the HAD superfamily
MIHAITLDLDDTLWPIEPVMLRAERELDAWMREHCPEVAEAYPIERMRALRQDVWDEHPHLSHDFAALRRLSLARAFAPFARGEEWVERAFEVFHTARHCVELYPETHEALARLAARFPLASLSNGTAEVHRVGLGEYFVASIQARNVGVAKPDPRIFHRAAQHLGLAPHQIAHVGDDPELDVLGARGAGMLAVWLNRHGASWQHDDLPDLEIRALDELEPALEKLIGAPTPKGSTP